MMIARTCAAAMAGLLLIASGCTAANPVVRAQSPMPSDEASQIQQTGFHKRGIVSHPVYDATVGHNANVSTTFHDGSHHFSPDTCQTGACPSGACPSGACPPSYGGHACPSGNCGHVRCLHPKCVRDSRSYSYSQPKDLVYPVQNQGGGMISYPYYTHKGPSDFFRQ